MHSLISRELLDTQQWPKVQDSEKRMLREAHSKKWYTLKDVIIDNWWWCHIKRCAHNYYKNIGDGVPSQISTWTWSPLMLDLMLKYSINCMCFRVKVHITANHTTKFEIYFMRPYWAFLVNFKQEKIAFYMLSISSTPAIVTNKASRRYSYCKRW